MCNQSFKAEDNAELEFTFPSDLIFYELDKQGVQLPKNMKLVDIVIERKKDILLVEVKDPSITTSRTKDQNKYLKKLQNNEILTQELTPKARDSYVYMHLMEKDNRPFKYIVLIGLEAFDNNVSAGILSNYQSKLAHCVQNESFETWKRKHIESCVVLNVEKWNKFFPDWPVTRVSAKAS